MKSRFSIHAHKPAFSILEMLVSMVVLSVMLVLLNSLVGHVSQTWRRGKASSDNQSKARIALDIVARDLASSILDEGLPGFLDPSGKPSLTFYSAQCGPTSTGFSDRPLSLINYRLMDTGDFMQRGLQRAQVGFDFSTPPESSAEFPAPIPSAALSGAQYQVIGPGILRMAFCFRSADGRFTDTLVSDPANAAAASSSVTLCLLVVDEDTLQLIQADSHYADLLQRFDQAIANSAGPGKMLASWTNAIRETSLYAGMPAPVAQSLAIYERTVPLPLRTP